MWVAARPPLSLSSAKTSAAGWALVHGHRPTAALGLEPRAVRLRWVVFRLHDLAQHRVRSVHEVEIQSVDLDGTPDDDWPLVQSTTDFTRLPWLRGGRLLRCRDRADGRRDRHGIRLAAHHPCQDSGVVLKLPRPPESPGLRPPPQSQFPVKGLRSLPAVRHHQWPPVHEGRSWSCSVRTRHRPTEGGMQSFGVRRHLRTLSGTYDRRDGSPWTARSSPVRVVFVPAQPGEQCPVVRDRPRVVVSDRRDEFVAGALVDPKAHPVP